ncbi:MAG: AAA family ATPase [Methylobacteriaceae bacterium]|nr:AAA family ATPase [Methylobacteriaceae bacterium]
MAILDTLSAALAANPVLAGGVGTLAFGGAMYVLRKVPEAAFAALDRALWTTLSVESLSNEYRDVDALIERCRLPFFARALEARDGALKTGFGGGWGVWRGTLFRYAKSKSQAQGAFFETITVAFLTRDRGVVARFVEEARPEEHRNSIQVTLYGPGGQAGGLRRRKRRLDTVFVEAAVKARLVERLRWFLGAENWHRDRGIPWKLGIVLHGPPGTGKTSLIHALASEFGFDVKYVKSLHGLGQAFMSGGPKDLFVIEDIDALSGALDRTARDGAVEPLRASPLHEILNAMDGMQTPDGLKFIVTTNHLARLDPALLRPGRIDEAIEIGPLSLASARAMFRAFYGREGIDAYAATTGAELQRLFSTMDADAAEAELARAAASQRAPAVSAA